MILSLLRVALCAALACCSSLLAGSVSRVVVPARDVDRLAQIVRVTLSPDTTAPAALRDMAGHIYPLQPDGHGSTVFIVPTQRAGETLALSLIPGLTPVETVTVSRARGDLGVNVDDRRTIVYQMDKDVLPRAGIDAKFKRAAYLHPIVSPAGIVVTGDYPSNHPHHHGIWTSWSKVQFQGRATNFWEMAEEKGTTEFVGLDHAWNGAVHGGFLARQQLIDRSSSTPVTAINETWEVTAYHLPEVTPPARVFDLVVTQSCATPDPVLLPKHLYGGLGFRGRDEWNGKDNAIVLTSEGATTRDAANTTRVRWCYLGGAIEGGAIAGLAILSHPDNFRTPEFIRVHPDMPFLSFAPVQSGDMKIEPGKPLVARYRFVVTDGPPNRAQLDAYWNAFAHPAEVTIESN